MKKTRKTLSPELREYFASLGRIGGKSGKGQPWRREVCRHAANVRWRAHKARKKRLAEEKEQNDSQRAREPAIANSGATDMGDGTLRPVETEAAQLDQVSVGGVSAADPAAAPERGVTTGTPTDEPKKEDPPVIPLRFLA
jgi:hypothetical protein